MTTAAPAQPGLADRLRSVRVGARDDLETTRHVFRGETSYIVRDPLTFQSHRFNVGDYRLFVAIDPSRPLSDVFEDLCKSGVVEAAHEEQFYQFVFGLHRMGFLALPISDDKLLFQRYQQRQSAKRREKMMSFLFLRVPLWNPDAFLSRTMKTMAPFFSKTAFVLWCTLLLVAGVVGFARAEDLWAPINGILAASNLPLIWLVLILLKAWHEFGHAYACKHFGGHVPEMGVYLIAFTPCAYVDATSSWSFTRRRDRLIVSLAGMYFESMIAAVALLVWAATSPGMLNSVAYNVIFLAGLMTLLFNINPLMRYDGYYILSDMLEIPNLRSRSTQYVTHVLKRVTLGIRTPQPPQTYAMKACLFGFGTCASLYRTLVFLGIAALIATKFFFVGLALAVVFLGQLLFGIASKVIRYCWFAEESAPVRVRAVAVSVFALLIAPVGLALLPIAPTTQTLAVVTAEYETTLRAAVAGFVKQVNAGRGDRVAAAQPVVTIDNPDLTATLASAQTAIEAATIRRNAFRVHSPADTAREEAKLEHFRAARAAAEADLANLAARPVHSGEFVAGLSADAVGKWIETGETLAVICGGARELRTVLDETQFNAAQPQLNTSVRFRSATAPGVTVRGKVIRIQPAGRRTIPRAALTHLHGGDIVVDPQTQETQQPYFEITIRLEADASAALPWGTTGRVEFATEPIPLGLQIFRRLVRFTDKLYQS